MHMASPFPSLCWDICYSDISEAHHHLLEVVGSDMIKALRYAQELNMHSC